MKSTAALFLTGFAVLLPGQAFADSINATAETYQSLLPTLQAGDTLNLASGTYSAGLNLTNLAGTVALPIVIEGPQDESAIIVATPTTAGITLSNSHDIILQSLAVSGNSLPNTIGLTASGPSNIVYDIAVEGCVFQGEDGQQTDAAISTQVPTYGWIIQNNVVNGAGTGFLLGTEDGSNPFVGGIIAGNLIQNTLGNDIEIPFQAPWPGSPTLPTTALSTIIRDNVLINNDLGDGTAANVDIGGYPETGQGGLDIYEVFGNLFFHNANEALLNASGRITIHDNIFVDPIDYSIYLADGTVPLDMVHIYDNTFYGGSAGIYFFSAAQSDYVVGNLVFADAVTQGTVDNISNNLIYSEMGAAAVVNEPSVTLGMMNFYPLTGQAQGGALNLTEDATVNTETDYAIDFNGSNRGDFTFRGAYAGDGVNPGWALSDAIKGAQAEGGAGGAGGGLSTTATGPTKGGGQISDVAVGGTLTTPEQPNCRCSLVGGREGDDSRMLWFSLVPLAAAIARKRRRYEARL